ncbi:hypothetical protein G6F65_018406 [Rhizopus arrhizus]|nr:hypothetical protein G6F65_018406 [Rhizopus arrhizus]
MRDDLARGRVVDGNRLALPFMHRLAVDQHEFPDRAQFRAVAPCWAGGRIAWERHLKLQRKARPTALWWSTWPIAGSPGSPRRGYRRSVQHQHRGARGLARGQRGLRFAHLLQAVALVDTDLDLLLQHQVEHLFGCGLQLFQRVHMHAQRRARDVQAALLVQHGQVDAGDGAGGIAEADHQPARLDAVQRGFPGVLAHAVIHHRHLLAAGQFQHAFRDVLARVVDGFPGPVGAGQFCLFRAGDRADQLHT